MSGTQTESNTGQRRITYGAVLVLASLHDRDVICSVLARETALAESSAYRWLTELEEAGILEAEPLRRENGRAAVRYHLPDEKLGETAHVLVERLVQSEADPGTVPEY